MTWRNQTLKLLQSILIASKYPHNSLWSCCYSLFVPVSVLRHLDAIFSGSMLQNRHGPLLRLRFLRFFSGALLPNFDMIFKREFLLMWGQQLVDVFSVVGTNLLSWLITYIKSGGNNVRRTGLGWRIFVLTGERLSTRDENLCPSALTGERRSTQDENLCPSATSSATNIIIIIINCIWVVTRWSGYIFHIFERLDG